MAVRYPSRERANGGAFTPCGSGNAPVEGTPFVRVELTGMTLSL